MADVEACLGEGGLRGHMKGVHHVVHGGFLGGQDTKEYDYLVWNVRLK